MKMRLMAGLAALAMQAAGAARAGEVVVTLTGVEARGGDIYIQAQKESDFMSGRASGGASASGAQAGTQKIVLKNLQPGAYALRVMHDEDGDKLMRMNQYGMPLEGYAMSGARSPSGYPSFAAAKINVGDGVTNVTLAMTYPAK